MTGSNLAPLGMVDCTFELEKAKFRSDSIVCKNLTRPLNLGRDFLIRNQVSVKYSEKVKCILDYQQQELIASLDVEDKPQLMFSYLFLINRTIFVRETSFQQVLLSSSGPKENIFISKFIYP